MKTLSLASDLESALAEVPVLDIHTHLVGQSQLDLGQVPAGGARAA